MLGTFENEFKLLLSALIPLIRIVFIRHQYNAPSGMTLELLALMRCYLLSRANGSVAAKFARNPFRVITRILDGNKLLINYNNIIRDCRGEKTKKKGSKDYYYYYFWNCTLQ